MPVAGRVEELLPGTKVAQSDASIAGDGRPNLFVLHDQHLHKHYVDGVLNAGMLVNLSSHWHQGQHVVLKRENQQLTIRQLCSRMLSVKAWHLGRTAQNCWKGTAFTLQALQLLWTVISPAFSHAIHCIRQCMVKKKSFLYNNHLHWLPIFTV